MLIVCINEIGLVAENAEEAKRVLEEERTNRPDMLTERLAFDHSD